MSSLQDSIWASWFSAALTRRVVERKEEPVHSPIECRHSSESFHSWRSSIVLDSVVQNFESYNREKVPEEVLRNAGVGVWMSGRMNNQEDIQKTDPDVPGSDLVVG
jgi:hypothetical protein